MVNAITRYEIFATLGGNHYCEVFKARDHHADRWVGVMELNARLANDANAWQKLWDEVLQRGAVKHEYCVAVHDFLREKRWIVVEYMEGNLHQTLQESPLSYEAVRTVLRRSLQRIDWMHKNDKTHGDIRPKTLLFDRQGAVKLGFSPGLSIGGQIPSNAPVILST